MSVALFVVVDTSTDKVVQTGSTDAAALVSMIADPPPGRQVMAVTAASNARIGDPAPVSAPGVP